MSDRTGNRPRGQEIVYDALAPEWTQEDIDAYLAGAKIVKQPEIYEEFEAEMEEETEGEPKEEPKEPRQWKPPPPKDIYNWKIKAVKLDGFEVSEAAAEAKLIVKQISSYNVGTFPRHIASQSNNGGVIVAGLEERDKYTDDEEQDAETRTPLQEAHRIANEARHNREAFKQMKEREEAAKKKGKTKGKKQSKKDTEPELKPIYIRIHQNILRRFTLTDDGELEDSGWLSFTLPYTPRITEVTTNQVVIPNDIRAMNGRGYVILQKRYSELRFPIPATLLLNDEKPERENEQWTREGRVVACLNDEPVTVVKPRALRPWEEGDHLLPREPLGIVVIGRPGNDRVLKLDYIPVYVGTFNICGIGDKMAVLDNHYATMSIFHGGELALTMEVPWMWYTRIYNLGMCCTEDHLFVAQGDGSLRVFTWDGKFRKSWSREELGLKEQQWVFACNYKQKKDHGILQLGVQTPNTWEMSIHCLHVLKSDD